jgi:hypothetical protein
VVHGPVLPLRVIIVTIIRILWVERSFLNYGPSIRPIAQWVLALLKVSLFEQQKVKRFY